MKNVMESVKKLTWIDYVYYASCLGLMGYTAYLMYSLQEGSTGRLRTLRGVSAVCRKTAHVVGQWGMNAELAYNKLIDAERMN